MDRFQLAEVKANVESAIGGQVADVKTNPPPKSSTKKGSAVKSSAKKGGKYLSASSSDTSVILAPPTGVRQSTRKRAPKTYSEETGQIFVSTWLISVYVYISVLLYELGFVRLTGVSNVLDGELYVYVVRFSVLGLDEISQQFEWNAIPYNE